MKTLKYVRQLVHFRVLCLPAGGKVCQQILLYPTLNRERPGEVQVQEEGEQKYCFSQLIYEVQV